jgi:dipeptidyl aminopeptidase/acylaminoacyl peptidase
MKLGGVMPNSPTRISQARSLCIAGLAAALLGLAKTAAVSAAEPLPLSIYGSLPEFETAALSASGGRVAMIGSFNGKRRLVVSDAAAKPLLGVALGDAKIRGLYWAGEDTVLVYKSDTRALSTLDFTAEKVELYSMLVLPLDGKPAWSVFAGNPLIQGGVRGFYGIRLKGGRYYGYMSATTLERTDKSGARLVSTNPVLYEVDLETRKTRKQAPNIEVSGYRDWIIGPDGEVSATLDFHAREGDWVIRNRDAKRIATGTSATGGISLLGLGATPDTILYSRENEGGEASWIEQPLGGGEGREILEDISTRGALFDERTRQLSGYVEDGDVPAYRFFDPQRQKVIAAILKAFPRKQVRLHDWNDAFNTLVAETQGEADAGTWWHVSIGTGKAMILGSSYKLTAQAVAPIRVVRYKSGDGLDIAAVLTLPPGLPAKDLPVVVMPHGGPGARDYPVFDWWAQALASRGYAVLQPNFRGSTGYGAAFERAGQGEWGRKMQSDISDGLAHLVREGIANPARACIVGASYGGYAALAGVTLQKGIYRCAASVAGISDLTKMVATENRESGANATLMRVLKQELGAGRDLRAASPITFVEATNAPVLLVHGKDDTVVDYDQSADMAKALQRAGKSVEFVTLAGEDHWLSRSESRLAMLEAVVAFVEKHNPAGAASQAGN